MSEPRVIIVMLRQPDRNNALEMRTDPLWEFGSFGCTRCHVHNLMNPLKIDELVGTRLAFAQGGLSGIRLVHLTPPITTVDHGAFAEATWSPAQMPLTYQSAPTLVDNNGESDTPMLIEMIDQVRRNTPVAQFSSRFRSRRGPLPYDVGCQLVETYDSFRQCGATVARCYTDSLPFPPPKIDRDREGTYDKLREYSPFDPRDDRVGSLQNTHQASCRGSRDSPTCRRPSPNKRRC